jgi:ubiquinone/menaquinone biosynthesis C-methylase UbiE
MFQYFKQRSYELEEIDKGNYTPSEYEGCIIELQRVNRWLGDAWTLRRTLLRDVENSGLRSISILDVGAGSGELLRVASEWAGKTDLSLRLIGLELNALSARAILDESRQFPSISAVRGDAFQLPFAERQFDYVISSLFMHHFTEVQVVALLREMGRVASCGICIIDLHRHPIAYFLYTTIGRLILHNRLLRQDGALSILRSFKPAELLALGRRAGLLDSRVERHFPYRLVLRASPQSSDLASESQESQSLAETQPDSAKTRANKAA